MDMVVLQHSFSKAYQDALEDFNDEFSEVTDTLSDGKVGFQMIYLLMGKQYLKDILAESSEITRIIIPDFNLSTLFT